MKNIIIIASLTVFLFVSCNERNKTKPLILWYDKPAANWNEALPLGNGRMGAMVFGGIELEHLQLNENTLYSGEPSQSYKKVNITDGFSKVMDLLNSGKNDEADEYITKNWLGRMVANYQPMGDLFFKVEHPAEVTGYHRELDITNSILRISYQSDGVKYTREMIASHPDSVIVIRFKASKPVLDITATFSSVHPTAKTEARENKLFLSGQAPGFASMRGLKYIESWNNQHKYPEFFDEQGNRKFEKQVLYGDEIDGMGMFFESQLKAVLDNGILTSDSNSLKIKNSKEVMFVLSAATSFNGYDKSPSREGLNPKVIAGRILERESSKSWEALARSHTKDYKNLFGRVSLELYGNEKYNSIPTDQRLILYKENHDPSMVALLFQYGRYLMVSGSRPGGQPLNLQGIWNNQVIPPWCSAYTVNMNTEMNYWPAEVANLAECHEPLFRMVSEMAVTGRETAEIMYNRRGWVAHHMSTIWRETFPVDGSPISAFWNMSAGWLLSHFWEHYLFSGDTEFLKNEAYPLMREASMFYADWLVENEQGYLVTAANSSPENRFFTKDGKRAEISSGSTMDMTIVRELFTRTIEAAQLLQTDEELVIELSKKLARLLPFKIGAKGQLQEWQHDYVEFDPRHRHFSHLYGFHPGNQINFTTTPELFKAVKQSLLLRGDDAPGWSLGWRISFWARMFDGNHALQIINNLFKLVDFEGFGQKGEGGGLYRNLFDAYPPFQIDGNFGFTAGVAEMLVQSHAGVIHLLPALPATWHSGKVKGLCTRGGFVIDMEWENSKLKVATIHSTLGGNCRLRTNQPVIIRNIKTVQASRENPNPFFHFINPGVPINETNARLQEIPESEFHTVDFQTEKEKNYKITF